MRKFTLSKYILITEMIHYSKNLKESSDLHADNKLPQNPEITFEYHTAVPADLLTSLGALTNHDVDNDTIYIVLKLNNEPIGCKLFNLAGKLKFLKPFKCQISFPARHVYGFSLYIKPEFRSKGFGKLLDIEANRRMAKEFDYMDNLVRLENYVSNCHMQKLGFNPCQIIIFIKFFGLNFILKLKKGRPYASYRRILDILKNLGRPTLRWAPSKARIVLRSISSYREESRLTSYTITDSKDPEGLKGIFIAKDKPDPAFLKRLYPQGCAVQKNGTFSRKKLYDILNYVDPQIDFTIADVKFHHICHDLAKFKDTSFIPKWIRQKNNSFRSFTEFSKTKNRDAYNDIQRVKKYAYDYDFTKDETLLRFFYERMYCPHIQNRYSQEQVIKPFNVLQEDFKKGGLILLKDTSIKRYLSGSLVRYDNETLVLLKLGLLNGDDSLLHRDVLAALYVSCFQFMLKINAKSVDFGFSRAFLNDGVLRYKAKWGAALEFNEYGNVFLFKWYKHSKPMCRFLSENPFISLEDNRLIGNVFMPSGKDMNSEDEINRVTKHYKLKGLEDLKITRLNESSLYSVT